MKTAKAATVNTKTAKIVKKAKAPRFTTELSDYKGNALLTIVDTQATNPFNSKFSFGVGKAKKILACIADIEQFVEDNDKDGE